MCPVDDKLISRFRGSWTESGVYETQVFAYMKTFRFTGSPALYIECDVRMCHGRCPSQPCHWRNSKNLQKRSVPEVQGSDTATGVSDNINLFQSLRVLQEEDPNTDTNTSNSTLVDTVCLRYGALSTLIGLTTAVVCMLTCSLFVVCFRLRRSQKSKEMPMMPMTPRFDHKTYMTHKGRIN